MNGIHTVGVVGAGLAGLTCARALRTHGLPVRIFDKGRRIGGRLATRHSRAEPGLIFDHGAQFATARDTGFRALIDAMARSGTVVPWAAAGGADATDPRWVGIPSMTSIADALADSGAVIDCDRHVGFLHATPDGWQLRHLPAVEARPGQVTATGGALAGPFDAVLLAIPAPQAAGLLAAIDHPFAMEASRPVIAPCWAAMLAFADPQAAPDVQRPASGPLGWIARENSRPGRAARPDCWTLHATPAWSRANLERDPAAVAADLHAAFVAATGIAAPPMHRAAHRWRYAATETPLGAPCLWDPATRLGLCGDWCIGARVEAAFLSGQALAEALASS